MNIAYLAPEIPALSATFVYNEILQLEALGKHVVPFSVHEQKSDFQDFAVNELKQRTLSLYGLSKIKIIYQNIILVFSKPKQYFSSLRLLFSDVNKVGFGSRIGFGLIYRFLYSGFLAKKLIDKQCSHIHVHFAHVPTDIAMYAASLANISFSVTAHANDIFERRWLLKEKVERSAFFATISVFNKLYLADQGVNINKIQIVRCGVDCAQFSSRITHHNQNNIIGVVARLVEKKGIDTLIRSLVRLKQQGIGAKLLIAGSGPLENELHALVASFNLSESDVQFIGPIDHTQVSEFLKSLDVFVLPCKQDSEGDMDGIPVVLMEAMLAGVPVISTELSGIPELIIDKQTGLLVQPGDDLGLADSISFIFNKEDKKLRFVRNAINKVKSEFSLDQNTAKLNYLFDKVLFGQ